MSMVLDVLSEVMLFAKNTNAQKRGQTNIHLYMGIRVYANIY